VKPNPRLEAGGFLLVTGLAVTNGVENVTNFVFMSIPLIMALYLLSGMFPH